MSGRINLRRVGLVLVSAILFGGSVFAQSRAPEPTAPPATQNAPANAAPEHGAPARSEPAEDETAQFKHSGSVRMIAKITGLSVDGAYWLAVAINFAIVAGAIVWVSKKNLPAVFRDRTALIQRSLEEARKASQDASRRISEIEARLSRLDDEISQMRHIAQKESAAEEARIKAAADEETRRIVESAEQEIDAAAKAARRELSAHAADLAVSLAAKQIHVDAPTDQALVRRFAEQLSSDGAPRKRV